MKISHMAWGLVAAIFATPPALAAEDGKALIPGDFSANVGVFSDYTFRGISQTGNEPALQGGIDYSIDTGVNGIGLYLGTWGSNVDFSDGDQASVEIDWYGGLSKSFGKLDTSIGFLYYTYPGAADRLNYDFVEATLSLGYAVTDSLSVGLGYNYTPENFGDSGTGHYVNGSVSYAVPIKALDISLDASAGYVSIDKEAVFGTPDYWDWTIGATLSLTPNVAVTVFYTDTDLSTADCASGGNTCDARGQVSLTASF